MLLLSDVRDFVAGLGITEDENVYSGKLDGKKHKSIGIYNRKSTGVPITAIGDISTYDIKPISLLVHWTKSQRETEKIAIELFEKLKKLRGITIGQHRVYFIRMQVPHPQDVGTDDEGIYEYVIWFDIIYERER